MTLADAPGVNFQVFPLWRSKVSVRRRRGIGPPPGPLCLHGRFGGQLRLGGRPVLWQAGGQREEGVAGG